MVNYDIVQRVLPQNRFSKKKMIDQLLYYVTAASKQFASHDSFRSVSEWVKLEKLIFSVY